MREGEDLQHPEGGCPPPVDRGRCAAPPMTGIPRPLVPRGNLSAWFANPDDRAFAVALATVAALVLLPLYGSLSLWIGCGIFLGALSVCSMASQCRRVMPFQQFCVTIAVLQLVVAPWAAHYFPLPSSLGYNIGDHLSEYMDYAGPACLALALGLLLPMALNHPGPPVVVRERHGPQDARVFVVLFAVGMFFKIAGYRLPGMGTFVGELLQNLAYVGVMSLLILRHRWWKAALVLLLVQDITWAVRTTMFHGLLLWGGFSMLAVLRAQRWSYVRNLILLSVGFISLLGVQQVKFEARLEPRTPTEFETKYPALGFAVRTLGRLRDPETLLDPERLAWTAMRFNQGWIVSKVMRWVPAHEPYARGQTLRRAAEAALLPRFLAPGKLSVGGYENFERFTGHGLMGASMDLGFAGEMYANFGRVGGWAGVFVYGLIVGLGYAFFQRLSWRLPLWIPWGVYVMLITVKTEDGVGNVLNWMTKSMVVVLGLTWFEPRLRRWLWPATQRVFPGGTANR